jgi:hypothetical protein
VATVWRNSWRSDSRGAELSRLIFQKPPWVGLYAVRTNLQPLCNDFSVTGVRLGADGIMAAEIG